MSDFELQLKFELAEAATKIRDLRVLLRDIRKDLELRATVSGDDSVVPLGNTLYGRLVDATEPQ